MAALIRAQVHCRLPAVTSVNEIFLWFICQVSKARWIDALMSSQVMKLMNQNFSRNIGISWPHKEGSNAQVMEPLC